MINDYEFEKEIMSDEELEAMADEEFEALVEYLFEGAEDYKKKSKIINPIRMKGFIYAYKILNYIAKEAGAKIVYKLHDPFIGAGSIRMNGKNLRINNPRLLATAAKIASNFNIYPKLDGSIQIDFGFYNLTTDME